MKIKELTDKLKKREEKVSKASKVKALLTKQKALWRNKQGLTDFDEPVLFLARRNGVTDIYEKATGGKFVFEHSNGKSRFIELRPSDQQTFPYGNKRVRCYFAHEDRPYAGWDDPIVDSESVMLGYEKTKATDLKFQERMASLKAKGKWAWVWIILAIAGAVMIIGFAYMNWIQPALEKRDIAKQALQQAPPIAGFILLWIKKTFKYY